MRRILCIDGGGIHGTFPAAFLAGLEEQLGSPLRDHFDLISGTSTGGIIAIGLALGISSSEILALYETRGPAIFGQDGSRIGNWLMNRLRAMRHLSRPKFGSDRLREALEEVFGDRQIGHAKTRLVVPAWSPSKRRVYIYKTAHHPRLQTDFKSRAVDAAMATASVPTYFRQYVTANDVGLIDGGVWANNPIAVAVVEAVGLLGWPGRSLRVLSLGCLEEVYSLPSAGGWATLNKKLLKLFMDGQAQGALGMAKLLTGHEHERTAIHRVEHAVCYGDYAFDDVAAIRELKGIGFESARSRFPTLEEAFFAGPVEPFVPCHQLEGGQ